MVNSGRKGRKEGEKQMESRQKAKKDGDARKRVREGVRARASEGNMEKAGSADGERHWLTEPSWLAHVAQNLVYIQSVLGRPAFWFGFLTLGDWNDKLSRNVGKKLPLLAA